MEQFIQKNKMIIVTAIGCLAVGWLLGTLQEKNSQWHTFADKILNQVVEKQDEIQKKNDALKKDLINNAVKMSRHSDKISRIMDQERSSSQKFFEDLGVKPPKPDEKPQS